MTIEPGAPMHAALIVLACCAALLFVAFVWSFCCAAGRADDASERDAKMRGIDG